MGELTIRRNRGFSVPRYQRTEQTKKSSGSSRSQSVSRGSGLTVSETLRQLMTRVSQAENQAREGRQTLQTGESVLAEVQDSLERIGQLAQEAAGGSTPDRAALQAELEQLGERIDQMIRSAIAGDRPLFLEEDAGLGDEAGVLLQIVMTELAGKQDAVQALPNWLLEGIRQGGLTPEQILSGLGLDETASGAEILAALANAPLESNPAAARLAALYLGAVIAGAGEPDPERAFEGLRQLLEKVSEGVPLDEAIEELTNGSFSSLEEFQAQFTGGTAPGLTDFLVGLLLTENPGLVLDGASILSLLAGMEGMNLDLLLGLLASLPGADASLEPGAASPAAASPAQLAGTETARPPVTVLQLDGVQVMGRDLSGVSFQASAGVLILNGTADVTLCGTGQESPALLITGSGTVTLQNVASPSLTVDAGTARLFSAGENALGSLQLGEGTVLNLDGNGQLSIETVQGRPSSALRLTGGAVMVTAAESEGGKPALLPVPVLLDGPVSLAAQASSVRSLDGKPLEPFDVVWKTLLPGWSSITSMAADGKQVRTALWNGNPPDLVRLWLDPSHGHPVHTVVIRGKDQFGRPRTRYAYLHWNQRTRTFEEIEMYPNPFTVTGGEPGQDWIYEEESQTLRILSAQVTALSGGPGTDANQEPFSGRIALADDIGEIELSLGNVVCRVSSGKAFCLGRENRVALLLQSGTSSCFESGLGCAGISLGEGTWLSIDCPAARKNSRSPAGSLTATGGAGGAGIGRDSGAGREQTCQILIQGGVITATGTGGGAGIGAGKHGAMGSITLTGGTITSTGSSGGGAGIGGALGAPAGDICIRGGTVTAMAVFHAAAIGAGIQGECGDILITGTARIVKALGGNPGADIGGCLFGGCGKLQISGGADIGGAKLWTQAGVPLRMGEDTVMLPQFRLSSRALQLNRLSLSTREQAQAAQRAIQADRRWVGQIQTVYRTLYGQLEQSFRGLHSVHPYLSGEGAVRDTATASSLLRDMRQSILLQPSQAIYTHSRRDNTDVRQFLE